jgi:hypothetical protein
MTIYVLRRVGKKKTNSRTSPPQQFRKRELKLVYLASLLKISTWTCTDYYLINIALQCKALCANDFQGGSNILKINGISKLRNQRLSLRKTILLCIISWQSYPGLKSFWVLINQELLKRDLSWLSADKKRKNCLHTLAGVKITITVFLLNRLSHKAHSTDFSPILSRVFGLEFCRRRWVPPAAKGSNSCKDGAVNKSCLLTVGTNGDRKRKHLVLTSNFSNALNKLMVVQACLLCY